MHDWFRMGRSERAPYALPEGAPALQDSPFYTRRSFVISVGAVGLIGSAGFILGRTSAPEFPTEEELAANLAEMELAWAQSVARGPMETLLRDYVGVVALLDTNQDDSDLWIGIERLAGAALVEEGDGAVRLLERLLLSLRSESAPASARAYIPKLEERLRSIGRV